MYSVDISCVEFRLRNKFNFQSCEFNADHNIFPNLSMDFPDIGYSFCCGLWTVPSFCRYTSSYHCRIERRHKLCV